MTFLHAESLIIIFTRTIEDKLRQLEKYLLVLKFRRMNKCYANDIIFFVEITFGSQHLVKF